MPAARHAAPEPHNPETEQWSREEQLLAAVRDELHFLRYAYNVSHFKAVKWKPEALPRPGVGPSRPKRAPTTEQADVLWAHLQVIAPSPD